jgi:hypothetical protein
MALPAPNRPEYTTTIPSSGKKVKYQPFSVKEEKILVLAAEAQDNIEIANAVAKTLRNCVVSPQDFNVDELALFDIEFLFLKCRAKSVGEKVTLRVTDPSDETFTVEHSINIDKITVDKPKEHKDLIQISDDIQLKMKYPDITFFANGVDLNTMASTVDVIAKCVSAIVHDDEVYNRADMTDSEIEEWIESLSTAQYNKVIEFFLTMPRLKHTITLKNTNTGNNFSITLEGLADFF